MSRFATRITVSSAWAGMLQSRLAARAANASLMARSLGDWWDHHAAVNMQTVPSRASPFGLRGLAESRQQRAETRHDARRLVDRQLLLERHVQAHVSLSLRPEFAQIADQAVRAAGLARQADVAAVQDQPMVRVLQVFRRRELEQFLLYLERILARSDAGAVGDAEDVRVDRHRWLAECRVEHHVRRLAADAGKALQRFAARRHFAAVLLEQDLRQRHYVLRLGAVKPDSTDVLLQARDAELDYLLGSIESLEQHGARLVHRLVGRLGRQHDRDQQLIRRAVLELGGRVRIRRLEAAEDLAAFFGVHRLLRASAAAITARRFFAGETNSGCARRSLRCRARCFAAALWPAVQAPFAGIMSMQSTGQGGRHSAQPMHQGSTTVCIS